MGIITRETVRKVAAAAILKIYKFKDQRIQRSITFSTIYCLSMKEHHDQIYVS